MHTFTLERGEDDGDGDGELSSLRIAFGGRDAVGIHVAVSFAVEVLEAIGARVKTLAVELAPSVKRTVLAPLERAAAQRDLRIVDR